MARMMDAAIQGSAESCAVAGLLSPPAVAWNGTACAGAALLDDASAETIILPPGALVPRRLARRPFYVLRYASVVECGAADSSSVCLAFKTVDPTRADGLARFVAAGLGVIRGAVAADGLNFSTAGLVVPPRIRPESFCHNLAGPLRLPDGTFLMLGGESNFWTASSRRTTLARRAAGHARAGADDARRPRRGRLRRARARLAVLEGVGAASAGNPRRPRRLRRPPAPHRLPRL